MLLVPHIIIYDSGSQSGVPEALTRVNFLKIITAVEITAHLY